MLASYQPSEPDVMVYVCPPPRKRTTHPPQVSSGPPKMEKYTVPKTSTAEIGGVVGVAVGTGVFVGGIDVLVGGTEVFVGRMAVDVGGT
jgi:hypothetical protein